jgi:hypothetical protein
VAIVGGDRAQLTSQLSNVLRNSAR